MMITSPLQVDFNVTNRCSLFCKYCYASANDLVGVAEELSVSEIKTLFKQLSDLGLMKLQLAGGEPLLRKDFVDILDLLPEFNFATLLNTTAINLYKVVARKISQSDVDVVTVSLEGHNGELHDKIKGGKSFEAALRGISLLQKYGQRMGVAMTLNSLNIDYVFLIIDLAEKLGVELFAIQLLCPSGRLQKNTGMIPSWDKYRDFFIKLTNFKKTYKGGLDLRVNVTNESDVFWEFYFPLMESESLSDLKKVWGMDIKEGLQDTSLVSCVAGKSVCSINANGDVYPCEMLLGVNDFCAGNVRKESFGSIWRNSQVFSDFRKLKRKDLEGACGGCEHRWCGGGCRAAAYYQTGSIKGPNINCRVNLYEEK